MTRAGLAARGIEALIDLVLSYVILYIVAAATGSTTEGGGFYLSNGALYLGLALCLASFVVCEALWGATLGKLATNLRVVREDDGGPIGWSNAIIRNLMRFIDGLVFYLVGFICICVTSRRQRLGDLAAGTMVVRRGAQDAQGPRRSS